MSNMNQYYVFGKLYRLDGDGQSIDFITFLSQSTINPSWNQIICLPGKSGNDTTQIEVELTVSSLSGSSTSKETQTINVKP